MSDCTCSCHTDVPQVSVVWRPDMWKDRETVVRCAEVALQQDKYKFKLLARGVCDGDDRVTKAKQGQFSTFVLSVL